MRSLSAEQINHALHFVGAELPDEILDPIQGQQHVWLARRLLLLAEGNLPPVDPVVAALPGLTPVGFALVLGRV